MNMPWKYLAVPLLLALVAGGIGIYTGMKRAIEHSPQSIAQKTTTALPSATELESNGTTLLQRCQTALRVIAASQGSDRAWAEFGWCVGYVMGIAEGHTIAMAAVEHGGERVCPPDGWQQPEHLVRSLEQWLRTHPTLLHMDRTVLAALAFSDTFPCPSVQEKNQR
jgi:hypothetical protein